MNYIRSNARLLPLNILLIVGGLIWAGCATEKTDEISDIPAAIETTRPTHKTTTTFDDTWPINGWTSEEAEAFYEGVASTSSQSFEMNACVSMTIVRHHTTNEVVGWDREDIFNAARNAYAICLREGIR